jgi:hypothetical protein
MIEKILYVGMFLLSTFIFVVTKVLFELRKRSARWKEKVRQLSIYRKGRTRKDFIRYFKNKGYRRRIIKFVYGKVQEYIKAKNLILLPEDDFRIVYEVDEEEWSYYLMDWFDEIRRPLPDIDYFNYLNEKYQKVNFEYLMELFDPKEQEKQSAY